MRNSLVRLFSAASFIVLSLPVHAATFAPGEKISYVLKWKNGALTVKAGYLKTEIVSLSPDRMTVKATATSTNLVDAFYPIRYTVQSVIDLSSATLPQSTQFELHGHEKDEYKDQTETFSSKTQTGSLSLQINKKERSQMTPKKKVQLSYPLTEPVQDVLSMLYLVRSASLPQNTGGTLSFKTVYEGEVWSSTFKCLGTETLRVAGKKVTAFIYQMINLSPKGEKNDATKLWLAQDQNKTLVKVESEVQVGKIQLFIRDTEGSEE